jgi:hypothetical protein
MANGRFGATRTTKSPWTDQSGASIPAGYDPVPGGSSFPEALRPIRCATAVGGPVTGPGIIDRMPQSSWSGAGVHPDLPTSFVHFTGRPRGTGDRPPDFAAVDAEQRLVQILQQGLLRAAPTFGTAGPILSVSESTESAIKVMLSNGVTARGPYAPWALLLDRDALIANGFRPVWPMSAAQLQATSQLPAADRDLRVKYEPGTVDWLAEREWRRCWGDAPIGHGHVQGLQLTGLLSGVIVGRRRWMPPPITTYDGWSRGSDTPRAATPYRACGGTGRSWLTTASST